MTDSTVSHDLRHAVRTFRAQPGYAAAAVLMLALAIGATTAMFSVVKAVLIDPLPYPDADRLVTIVHNIGGIDQAYFNDAIFLTYANASGAFESVGAWAPEGAGVTITGASEPEEVRALKASRGLLTTLGVQPELGRWFSAAEDAPGSPGTVMISAAYWQQMFGRDANVVGRTLVIDGRAHEIVGVMPAAFDFAGDFDVLLPLRINTARPEPFFHITGIARLRPGVTLESARADMSRVLEIYFDTYKANPTRSVRWVPLPTPLKRVVIGDVAPMLWVLMATIAIVLLMACGNVATLWLIRAESRHREWAIRAALGAGWSRIARSLLVESMLLTTMGGAIGLAIAAAGLRLLVAVEPDLPRLGEIGIDPVVIAVAIGLTVGCGLVVGLIPMVKVVSRRSLVLIGLSPRHAGLPRERARTQHGLVAAQVALALMLLVCAGLMIRTVQALQRIEPGFTAPQTLQTFNLTLPPTMAPDLEQVFRIQREVLDRVAALPGVTSTAFTTRLPMDPEDRWSAALTIEDRPHDGRRAPPNHQVKVISPGAFHTFGTPIVAGRDFTWTDLEELRDVAIVSANLARHLWGSAEAAVGKRVRQFYASQSAPFREIVGVAADVYDDGLHAPPPTTVYWPGRLPSPLFGAYQPRRVAIAIRTERAGTSAFVNDLRVAVASVSRNVPLGQLRTLDQLYDRSMSRISFALAILAIAGTTALLLGIGGLYGVIAYAVAQRRREIGIRMALGAQARQIRALFIRRGLSIAAIGLVVGLAGAMMLTRLMQSLLYGVEPLDPITFTATPLVLAAAALVAAYVPARRASLVDPVQTMRPE